MLPSHRLHLLPHLRRLLGQRQRRSPRERNSDAWRDGRSLNKHLG